MIYGKSLARLPADGGHDVVMVTIADTVTLKQGGDLIRFSLGNALMLAADLRRGLDELMALPINKPDPSERSA